MAVFFKIDMRAAAVIGVAAVLVIWSLVMPESFNQTFDMVGSAIQGAIDGAQEAV